MRLPRQLRRRGVAIHLNETSKKSYFTVLAGKKRTQSLISNTSSDDLLLLSHGPSSGFDFSFGSALVFDCPAPGLNRCLRLLSGY
jgi:hypothetical protein